MPAFAGMTEIDDLARPLQIALSQAPGAFPGFVFYVHSLRSIIPDHLLHSRDFENEKPRGNCLFSQLSVLQRAHTISQLRQGVLRIRVHAFGL
jgi:hypothetical protein